MALFSRGLWEKGIFPRPPGKFPRDLGKSWTAMLRAMGTVQPVFRGDLTWKLVLKSFHMRWLIYLMIWIRWRKRETHCHTSTSVIKLYSPELSSPRIQFLRSFCSLFLNNFYLFSFHGSLYGIPFMIEFIHSEFPWSKIASCSQIALLTLLGDGASAFKLP